MRRLIGLAVIIAGLFAGMPYPVSAAGLKVAPLEYKTSLAKNERKQGFIDVSNPAAAPVRVSVSVQAFRQVDNDGGLQFYDDKQVATGIKPELTDFELGPRQALRLFFTIDGGLLAQGDTYGAIFFATEPSPAQNGVGQSVRVGTLFSVVNQTPGSRTAVITDLAMPFLQLEARASGSYRIKNTGPPTSGFYPTVRAIAWPTGQVRDIESSLLFGGRERANDFSLPLGYGIHRLEVSYGSSKRGQWVVLIAPWMLVAAALVALIVAVELYLLRRRRNLRQKRDATHTITS